MIFGRINAEQYTGFKVVAVGTTNVSPLTGLSGATIAQISCEGSAIRYRLDGVTAHSASGHLAVSGDVLILHGSDTLQGFRAICPTVTGTLMISVGYL